MKNFYLTLLFSVLTYFLQAQQNFLLQGKVHREDGMGVSHVTLQLEGTNLLAITDMNGHYSFGQVPSGKYKIRISSIEIKAKKLNLDLHKNYPDLHVHIDPKGSLALDEVRVEAKSEKRKMETSGFAVNVIDTKEASLRNVQTNELLDRTVGVRVLQSGGLGSEVQYNLNGMTGRSVGIFIDGIELSTYGTSFNLNSIPPSMIERIEVFKGVLPAHLSGDLLGGAINIVLKKGSSTNNLTTSISYGSFNTKQADISGTYRNAKNGFTARASGFYTSTDNDYEIWGKFSKFIEPNGIVQRNYRTKRFYDAYKSQGARFEVGYTDVSWADAFLLGYNYSDSYKEIQHGQTMGNPYKGRFSEATAHVLSLNYKKQDLFIKGLALNVNAVYSNRETYIQDTIPYVYNWDGNYRYDLNGNPIKNNTGGQQGNAMILSVNRKILNTRTNLSYDIVDGHRFSVNHTFKMADRKDEDLLNPHIGNPLLSSNDVKNGVYSFNYEVNEFNNRLTANVFYKLYQQSLSNTIYRINTVNDEQVVSKDVLKDNRLNTGFGIALSYQVLPKLYALASTERAVRMADENEIFGNPEGNVLQNIGIKPEISDNINAGFRVGTYTFDSHKFSFSANAFWRNMKDRIMPKANELLNSQDIEITQFVNLGKAQTLGFEGELNYAYKEDLTVLVNFSKFNSLFKQEFDEATGQKMTYYNKQIPNEPFFTVNANVHYRLHNLIQKASQVNLFYTLGYVGSFRTIWPESDWFVTPKQYAQNVGLSYRFPNQKFLVSVDAKNIFNAELYDKFAVQKPGRAFYLKLNYTINKF